MLKFTLVLALFISVGLAAPYWNDDHGDDWDDDDDWNDDEWTDDEWEGDDGDDDDNDAWDDDDGENDQEQELNLSKLNGIFSKYTKVFGVHIFATEKVPNYKLLHASKVMAKYLDSDDDGEPNNKNVVKNLQNGAMAFVARDESESVLEAASNSKSGIDGWQDLYVDETHVKNGKNGKFDASLEEILHLISSRGYESVFDELSCEKNSRLTKAVDKARGGHFKKIPGKYPRGAWYTYNDETCDYNCMCVEYFYWGLTTHLGGQSFPGRFGQIKQEWKVNGQRAFRNKDSLLYQIVTDASFDLPTVLPDGEYSSMNFEIMYL